MKKSVSIATGALAVALLVGGTAGVAVLHKEVALNIDGQTQQVEVFGLTVSDALSANGIKIAPGDIVSPELDSMVTDGQTINVNFAKPLTVTIDGQPHSFTTTAVTLDDAIDEVSSKLPDIEDARFSVSESTPLPRTGLKVEVTTPKEVELVVAGKKSALATTSATVGELLDEQNVIADKDDVLSHKTETAITEDLIVKLDKVTVETKTLTEAVKYKTETKNNSSMWKGDTRTKVKGKNGSAKRVYQITTVNGKVTDKVLLSEKILTKPVTKVVEKGTKVGTNGAGINLAREAQWNKIAKCESGGRWNINTGNGYYGGLQFNLATWRSVNGQDFAPYPHQATREQQITVANRLHAKRGFQPWSCRRVL